MERTQHQISRTDVAIIGGGPAGLQAALTLGRIHRDAVLFDDGTYRNARARHMHNVVATTAPHPPSSAPSRVDSWRLRHHHRAGCEGDRRPRGRRRLPPRARRRLGADGRSAHSRDRRP